MDYGQIINRSFSIAWKHKTLWLLGLFAGGGSSIDFNYKTDLSELDLSGLDWSGDGFPQAFDIDPAIIASFLAIGLIIGFIFMIFHLISVAGLTDATNKIVRGGRFRLFDSIAAGARQLLKFFGLLLLSIVAWVVGLLGLVLIGVLGFVVHKIIGILFLVFLIPALFFMIFVFVTLYSLCQRSMVVRDISIGDALSEAWYLFKTNMVPSAAVFALFILLNIGFGILAFMVFGLPALIFGLLAQSWLVGLMIFIIEFPIMLLVGGFIGTGFTNIYTLFYFELLEPGISGRLTYVPPPAAPSAGPAPV